MILRPGSFASLFLRPVSFASLHPASMSACCMLHACFLYLGSCISHSGWWSVHPEFPLYHRGSGLFGSWCPGGQAASGHILHVRQYDASAAPLQPYAAPCTSIFLFFGRPGDLPGHQKTMKITVLSFKFNVLLIKKKYPFEIAFACLLDHFGDHFGRLCAPWGSFWRCLASQSASKIAKR